ncbi:MAG: efflux RND transporter permease subunit [Planctomycetes bacterium]|nr:efflux RND transporter permease subunit [Planctomycetota bacterium]
MPVREGLSALTIRRPVATTMAVVAVAIFGLISLGKIPLELLPEISYPTITVRTEYPGAGPEDVEERVSKRIEETLAVLPGLESHSSVSRAGVSDVVLEFALGTNLSLATQDVRERLDRTPLPDDAEAPLILRYDPSLDPVMRISVHGERDLREIREIADKEIARGLASIPGVAAIKVRGGLESEIRVRLDGDKITSLGLDISEVDRRLKIENVNLASGTLVEGDTEYLVRTLNQFKSLDEVLALALADRDGQPIRVRDVGEVTRTHKDRDVVTRVDGRESVELLIHREADANIVDLAQAVRDRLLGSREDRALLRAIERGERPDPEALLEAEKERDQNPRAAAAPPPDAPPAGPGARGMPMENERVRGLRAQVAAKRKAAEYLAAKLPSDLGVRVLSDQSVFISAAIDEVLGAAVLGGLLAIFVLLLFLKNAAATAIIALSIPVSIIATFAAMFLYGTTLNIMSLGGLALGVGMLVDNSIVVLESIFRCREEGDDRRASALRGTAEVGMAVAASTLTTIAVFFPIAFVSGVAGQIFKDQALTVVFSLLSSLAVALFFIPMLAARGARAAGARPVSRREALALPALVLWRLLAPVLLWRRTLAVNGFFALLAPRRPLLRVLGGALFLPVSLAHLAVEIAGRLLLATLAAFFYLAAAAYFVLARALRLLAAPLQWLFDLAFGALQRAYAPLLRCVLVQPALTALVFALVLGAAVLSGFILRDLGSEMLPTVHQGELVVHAYLPVGTPVERSAETLVPLEKEILALPGVEQVTCAVGVARDEVADPDEGSHSARLLVKLAPAADLAAAESGALESMRALLGRHPEFTGFRFSRPTLFSIKAPLEVEAKGNDLTALREAAAEIAKGMKGLETVTDVRSTVTRGNPEVRLTFDRERLRRFGLDLEAIANRIRAQVQGVVSTRFAEGDRRIDMRVLADVDSVEKLLDMTVNRGRAVDLADTLDRGVEGGGGSSGSGSTRIRDRSLFPGTTVDLGSGAAIPLRQVAAVEVVEGPSEIRRVRGQRAAVVTANTAGFDVGGALASIQGMLGSVEARFPSVLCSIGGQGAEMGGALQSMRMALLLAVFLVYLVMASQFESIVQPLVILLTVPLALVGGVLSLYHTSTPISVVVFIGAVVLAGIVVNNAIVLVDYANQLRRRGKSVVDALVEAGSVRLRPILMTTGTTVLGLLPLAGALSCIPGAERLPGDFWRGSELQAPMAVTVIGGLTLSTLLTLVVIPAVYRLVVRERAASGKEIGGTEREKLDAAECVP